MKFALFTHVPHIKQNKKYFGYSPYIREMNIWGKYAEDFIVVAPLQYANKTAIHSAYCHSNLKFKRVASFEVTSIKTAFWTIIRLPKLIWTIFSVMNKSEHLHLRCPGNIGLLACFVQILFPNKKKTAKYAGNWDPKSKQPWTYKLQQKILQNTFLTRNMQVLIYGTWEGQTKNCKSFFTASYFENEKKDLVVKNLDSTIRFMFVGALVKGKNPLYAIRLVEGLIRKGFNVGLDLYGDGIERNNLEAYIAANSLSRFITLQGNQAKEALKKAYQQSHFTLLPSESEGWPKAIAEAMFWGSVPVATAVSCVPFMLDYESRGVLLTMNINHDIEKLITILQNNNDYKIKQKRAFDWSQQYTLDLFETEIKKLLI